MDQSSDPLVCHQPISRNCFYVSSNELTAEEVKLIIGKMIDQILGDDDKLPYRLQINMPSNIQGDTYGYCYGWTHEKVYHKLLKMEPLGRLTLSPVDLEYKDSEIYRVGDLFCLTTLPPQITTRYLVGIFQRYSTRGTPRVKITKSRKAYITFSNPDDCYFALCMAKKYYDPTRKITLYFDHAKYYSKI
ncbi:Hypothetical protein POVR1_LOCUS591 [uncultured virus]|nr:Hypothetical protein POVR1_LOCUS591 [uncultured virus]